MKKQLITSIVCFTLLLIMFLGSSIAWFSDSAASVNVMVAGRISIQQDEDFTALTVMPTQKITKKVTVTNDGNQPCYVRTLFAFEDTADSAVLKLLELGDSRIVIPGVTDSNQKIQFAVTKDGVKTIFTVGYYVYDENDGQLAAEGSYDCLESIMLKGQAENDWQEAVGDRYEVIVLSQACQVTGFTDSADAFSNTFGDISSTSTAAWFGYVLKNTSGYLAQGQTMTAEPYPAP